MSDKLDTDDALRGTGAAQKVRDAFDGAPLHHPPEERDAVKAWHAMLADVNAVEATPTALTFERSLIGHLLHEPGSLAEVGDLIRPEQFAQPELGVIFTAISDLFNAGIGIDTPSMLEALARQKMRAPWGDVLSTCARFHQRSSSAMDKARAVFGHFQNRTLASLGAALYHRARAAGSRDSSELVDDLFLQVSKMSPAADTSIQVQRIGDAATEAIEEIQRREKAGAKIPGLTTGLPRLDQETGGMVPSDVWIIKAGTSKGKTALALSLTLNAARAASAITNPAERPYCVIFSLEMKTTALALRYLSNQGSIDGMDLRLANLSSAQMDRLLLAKRDLRAVNDLIHLVHCPGITCQGVRRTLLRITREMGRPPAAVGIDYVQLLTPPPGRTREQEIAGISVEIQSMAAEFNSTFLLLSQVNAAGEARESRRLEHDADVVVFIKPRDESADPVDQRFTYDLMLHKNRAGRQIGPGGYPILFMKAYQRFVEVASTEAREAWWGKERQYAD